MKTFVGGGSSALLAGALAAYAPNQIVFSGIAAGVGACVFLISQKIRAHSNPIWSTLTLTMATISIVGLLYATVIDNYRTGQDIFVNVPNAQRAILRKGPSYDAEELNRLNSGDPVQYLDRTWRRIHFVRQVKNSKKRYFEYWRKIRMNGGEIGWIYGAYLSDQPD